MKKGWISHFDYETTILPPPSLAAHKKRHPVPLGALQANCLGNQDRSVAPAVARQQWMVLENEALTPLLFSNPRCIFAASTLRKVSQ